MLFDQRTREQLRDAGLDQDDLRRVEREAAAAAKETADRVTAFFEDCDVVYSDMDLTHSTAEYPEHDVEYVDLFTHSQDVRGWLRFDTWGVYVAGARVLEEGLVELRLGPTVHDRVRFARERETLE